MKKSSLKITLGCSCSFDDARTRFDPTGTTGIRRRFEADLTRRFRALKGLIYQSIVRNDAFGIGKFGIKDGIVTIVRDQAINPGRFSFSRSSEKVSGFMAWLVEQEERGILGITPGTSMQNAAENAWTNVYIESAYHKGVRDAGDKLRRSGANVAPTWIENAFTRPIHADRAGLAYTRAFNQLKGITDVMDQQISGVLANGLSQGKGPMQIAREINNRVDKIGITRARVIARTEVINAHAEATLNSYEEAGVMGVEVESEFTTAGDDAVCPECDALSGKTYTLDEAQGVIPVHPNAVFEGSTFVSYGECEEIVRARYSGPAVVLSMGGGIDGTTIGPNHPMLTARGFVNAAQITEGDYILYDLRNDNSGVLSNVNDKQIPLCEDTFKSSVSSSPNSFVSASGSDLHGDRVFCKGKVEAIRPARGLLAKRDVSGLKVISENLLVGADPYSVEMAAMCSEVLCFGAIDLTSASGVGRPDIFVCANNVNFAWVRVIHKNIQHFDGWAFDYSTASSLYCNNGFVVKNCRCAWSPKVVNGTGIELV